MWWHWGEKKHYCSLNVSVLVKCLPETFSFSATDVNLTKRTVVDVFWSVVKNVSAHAQFELLPRSMLRPIVVIWIMVPCGLVG